MGHIKEFGIVRGVRSTVVIRHGMYHGSVVELGHHESGTNVIVVRVVIGGGLNKKWSCSKERNCRTRSNFKGVLIKSCRAEETNSSYCNVDYSYNIASA